MAVIRVPRRLLERCEEFLRENPDLADNPKDLVKRCGRLGLRYLRKHSPGQGGAEGGGLVPIYVPAKDYEEVKRLAVDELGICNSVSNFYMLSIYMVLFGYWELPPKI